MGILGRAPDAGTCQSVGHRVVLAEDVLEASSGKTP
jgi:hypothetical protein